MRNPFFSRKNDAAATTCAAGFACSDVNTNSALLLTIDTVLAVSIFAILSILGITPPTGRANRYSRDNTTALGIPRVGPDRFGRGRFFV